MEGTWMDHEISPQKAVWEKEHIRGLFPCLLNSIWKTTPLIRCNMRSLWKIRENYVSI